MSTNKVQCESAAKCKSVLNVGEKDLESMIIEIMSETPTISARQIAYRDRSFYIQEYSAAIENMLLAIVSLGYQSCWYEGYITDVDKIGRQMADILGIPEDYELVCFLPVGIAAEPATHVSKKNFDERAWFNGFNKTQGSKFN